MEQSTELGLHRKTVRNYLGEDSKCTIVPAGPVGRKSQCAIHDEYIKELIGDGLSARRIFHDLKFKKGFKGGYDSVKRHVRKLGHDVELSSVYFFVVGRVGFS